MNTVEKNGVSWNTDDLFSCKNAFCMLLNMGFSFDELSELDFGNLDLFSVAEEF